MEASAVVTRPAGADAAIVPAAFERLFLREYARVAGIAYRVLGDASLAEDVAQDVFVSFYRRHDAEASYAPSWLYAASAHAALNAVRGRKRRENREAVAAPGLERVADPEGEAIASEERAMARAALARLPERTATLLVLRHSGLTYADIASALGIGIGQIGTRLRRAEEKFKEEVLHATERP